MMYNVFCMYIMNVTKIDLYELGVNQLKSLNWIELALSGCPLILVSYVKHISQYENKHILFLSISQSYVNKYKEMNIERVKRDIIKDEDKKC